MYGKKGPAFVPITEGREYNFWAIGSRASGCPSRWTMAKQGATVNFDMKWHERFKLPPRPQVFLHTFMHPTPAQRPLRVSVALCTHNGDAFIEEQIRSICQQSCAPLEIILSDDASSDRTLDLAEACFHQHRPANSDTVLRLIRNPTAFGTAKNFEQGLQR
jgi:cellulose synthase/poly-beta-1,6-N-acetylglucosamine synthase-like glycosyltransferase